MSRSLRQPRIPSCRVGLPAIHSIFITLALLTVFICIDIAGALNIIHGQSRHQFSLPINRNVTKARNQFLDLSAIGRNTNEYKLRYNSAYDFYYFTCDKFFGPHTLPDSAGMMMTYETEFAASRIKEAIARNNGTCTVVDVGSNFGYFSLLSMSLGCRVFAFEPAKNNFDLSVLNYRINGFKNFVAFNHPVGEGTVHFDGWSSMNLNKVDVAPASECVPLSFLEKYHDVLTSNKADGSFGSEPLGSGVAAGNLRGSLSNATSTSAGVSTTAGAAATQRSSTPIVIDWLKVDVEGYENTVLKTLPDSIVVRSLSTEITFYLKDIVNTRTSPDIDYTDAFRLIHNRFKKITDFDNGVTVTNLTEHTRVINSTKCDRLSTHYCQYNVVCY